jgi:phosphate uptake regulator
MEVIAMRSNKYAVASTEKLTDDCFECESEGEIGLEREIRKVQKLGNASLGISIPKEWAASKGITAGTLLDMIYEDNGDILLTLRGGGLQQYPTRCRIHADICPDPEMIRRIIIGCYVVGYDTIRIVSGTGITEEQYEKVRAAVDQLTGMTIMEQDEKQIVMTCIIKPPEFPIMSMIRRLFLLSSLIVERTLENAIRPTEAGSGIIETMELEIDRLYRLILRLLLLGARDREVARQIGIEDSRHMLGDRAIAAALESVGDLCESLIGQLQSSSQPKHSANYDEAIERILSMFRELSSDTSRCLFEHDLKAASQALDNAGVLEEACVAEIKTAHSESQPKNEKKGIAENVRPLIFSNMKNIVREYEFIVQIMMNRFIENPSHKFPYVEIETQKEH